MIDRPKLLLYTHGTVNPPLPYGYLDTFPWNQMVNRAVPDLNCYDAAIKTATIQDILNFPRQTKSFEEITLERANELKSLDGNIFIRYSGGIDSTTVLVSILHTWSKADLERVHIIMSTESIMEFPEMWKTIRETFKNRIHNSHLGVLKYLEQGYTISGELGDQLFGSDNILTYSDERLFQPWKDHLITWFTEKFIEKRVRNNREGDNELSKLLSVISPESTFSDKSKTDDYPQKEAKYFLDMNEETLAVCPFPITTVFDWFWWFNYTNKAQHVLFRDFMHEDYSKYIDRNVSFFNTMPYQRWSIDNHDKKIMKNILSYKWTAKQFIVKYSGHKSYINKAKVGSLGQTWMNRVHTYYGFDENYKKLSYEEIKSYVRK